VISPKEAIDVINERFGIHPGRRALHAKGTLCRGSFTATAEGAKLTRAAHMQGEPVPVIARVSNGGGNPERPDYATDVRGFAVGFELPDGSRTDIVAQTAPRFPVRTPDDFIELIKANVDGPARLVKLPLFLLTHREALPSLRPNLATLNPPTSYVTVPYYAIHAFKWVDAEGSERWVRYTLSPEVDEPRMSPGDAKKRGRDFLQEEIADRLARGSAHMKLELQVAAAGEDPHDPTSVWADEQRVVAGVIELTEVVDEEGLLVFDPVKITDGIELSNDPILRYRPAAYSESVERRMRPS
jgi:catalase